MSIVKDYLPEDLEIRQRHFPMNFNGEEKIKAWEEIALEIEDEININGKDVGFVTLGDPMIYSTYVYIMERLSEDVEVVTIPGISSFSNIASSNNFPLVMDTDALVVTPCTIEEEKLDFILQNYNCIVLMKVYKNFKEVIAKLEEYGLIDNAILVSNSSQEREKLYIRI